MAIALFHTQTLIIQQRSLHTWTVEDKNGNNVIGEINFDGKAWVFDSFFDEFTRMELLEIAEAMQRVNNIVISNS